MNVIFDMGGTIVENINASFERGFASIYPYTINANLSLNNFIDSTLQITFNILKNREDSMLEVSFKDILEVINNTFLFNISVEKQEEIFVNNFEEIKVIEGVETFLKFLNEHSINCYILSNSTFSSEYLKMQLRKAGISKYFKACISSADVGYRKPHPYFFNYLINKYHLDNIYPMLDFPYDKIRKVQNYDWSDIYVQKGEEEKKRDEEDKKDEEEEKHSEKPIEE